MPSDSSYVDVETKTLACVVMVIFTAGIIGFVQLIIETDREQLQFRRPHDWQACPLVIPK
jgi:hypothetical protein